MTGACAMCHGKFEKLECFSEWRGNCRINTFVCERCRALRAVNGGTCMTCKHYDASAMNSFVKGGCKHYRRVVGIADRCGQYEWEDEE